MSELLRSHPIFGLINDMVFIADRRSLHIVFANDIAQEIADYSQPQLAQLTLTDLFPGLDRQTITRLAQMKQMPPSPRLICADGTELEVEIRLDCQNIGDISCVICVANPARDSHALARKLHEQRTLYQALVAGIFDLYFRIRRDGTYVEFRIPSELGLHEPEEASEIIGKNVRDVVPQIADQVMPVIERVIDTGQPEPIEYQIDEHTGVHYYAAFFVPSLPGEMISVVRDVTETKRAENLLRSQRDLSVALSSEITLDQALELVLETAIELAEMDCGGVYLVDQHSRALRLAVHRGLSEIFVEQAAYYPPDSRRTQFVLKGKPIYAEYPQLPVPPRELGLREKLRAFAMVPIPYKNEVIGCINLSSHRIDSIQKTAQAILETIASQVGSAIVRLRTEVALQKRDRLLEAVAQASNYLLAADDISDAINQSLAIIGQATRADTAAIFTHQAHLDTASPVDDHHYYWSAIDTENAWHDVLHNHQWRAESTNWYEQLRAGKIISGSLSQFSEPERRLMHVHDMLSLLLIPIFIDQNTFWGFIGFGDCHEEREWLPEEVQVLKLMAASVGAAIQRQQTQETLRDERRFADTLREVGMALTSTLDFDEVLERILAQALRVVPYDAANIMLIEDGIARIKVCVGYENVGVDPIRVKQVTFQVDQSPIMQIQLQTGKPYVCPHVEQSDKWLFRPEAAWVKSWLGVPIVLRDEVVGFFSLDSQSPGFYGPRHVTLIEPFAKQAAIAFENASLFAETQALEKVKSEMIRMASHDLSSPLTRIRESMTLLRQYDSNHLTAQQEKYCDLVVRAILDMEQIITNILSLERIEAQQKNAKPIIWCDLIQHSMTITEAERIEKQHHLNFECDPDLPEAHGDPVWLQQAVVNLLGNAIKFTPAGGEITIRAFRKLYGTEETVAIEIEDNGIGIPYKQQVDLFQPFYRAAQSENKKTPGTGLGLSIVKQAVDYHKGNVFFDSVPGRGSLFGFWIPV